MKCPRDEGKLAANPAEGHSGLACATCHGAWVPNRLVIAIQGWRRFAATDFAQELQGATIKEAGIDCPQNCGPLSLASMGGIGLNGCPGCKGVWFDGGELKKLLALYPRREGNTEKAWTVLKGGDVLTMLLIGLVR